MPMTPERLFEEAMALDPREREQLADRIWRSLDDATRADVDAAWLDEIRRRIAAADRGEIDSIPASEAFAEARAQLNKS